MISAVFFDLHGTLGYIDKPVTPIEVSEFLIQRGYEVSPQAWNAAMYYVSMIDFPKLKFTTYKSFLNHVFLRLELDIDEETLENLAKLFDMRESYKLYPDALDAVKIVKCELGLKTAIVTTIPKFKFNTVIDTLSKYLDFVMTGAEAGCDKSNPKMYLKLLEVLNLTPEEVIVIGDSHYIDIILPKKLRMKTIQLVREYGERCDSADAHASNLIEAAEIVRKWMDRAI